MLLSQNTTRSSACSACVVKSWAGLPETASHAGDATLDLLDHYGADRLMFGTDFPKFPSIVADGGYQQTWKTFDTWAAANISDDARDALAGGTVSKLFGFGAAGSKL
eukprot:SAG22_NODE_1445_length_4406_cov_7.808684_2_plen_107_part_00